MLILACYFYTYSCVDYAGFANEASTIVSIREAYNHALADQEDLEQETEIKCTLLPPRVPIVL